MKVAILIIFLITMTDAKHHHSSLSKTVSESKDNFFGNVNEAIHSLLDTLFDSVNLATNFSNESNTKILLTMHYDLSNIADKNVDALNEIQNIIKVNVTTNQTQQMMELDSLLDEIFHEKHFDLHDIITGKHRHKHGKHKKKRKRTKKKFHINITSDFSDSKEFMDFVIRFLPIVNLTMKDFKRSSKVGRSHVPLKTNLKAWEPPSSIVITFFNDTNTRRIYRGRNTSVSSFPFIVSIHIMGEFSCTGSIISRGYIITAASCLQVAYQNDFFKTNLKSIYVRIGSDYTMVGGETIPAQNLYFHPEFEPEHLKNNLAIIKLERRIKFTRQQKRIRRIAWNDSPGNMSEDVKEVLILGWGAKKADQIVEKGATLSVDIVEVYNFSRCMDVYTEDFLSRDNFCAGSESKNGGACNGDVGGPGIVGAKMMGVISFGSPECGKAPTVFTKLGYYSQWIKSIVVQDKEEDTSNLTQSGRRRFNLKVIHLNVTSLRKKKKKGKHRFRVKDEDYPEEVTALKDILLELLKSDSDVVNEVLYGDVYEDLSDIFMTQENDEDFLFLNRSYLTYPDKPWFFKKTHVTKPIATTTRMLPHFSVTDPTFFIESITPINRNHSHNILRQRPVSESEEDINNTYGEDNEYTDNYERSSEEERGMSIEAGTTTVTEKMDTTEMRVKKVSEKDEEDQSSGTWGSSDMKKKVIRDTSSESIAQDSDDTSGKFEQMKKITSKKKIYVEETDNDSYETKSKSDELTTKFVPFVGTRMDLESLNIDVGFKRSTKKAKIVHMRNDRPSKKTKLTIADDTDKHLATRPYFYKLDSNKYIKSPSKSKKKIWDASVELRILHG